MPPVADGIKFRECQEYGEVRVEAEEILAPNGKADISREVRDLGVVSLDFKRGDLRLQAGGFVGVVPLNDRLILRIHPRTPIANLTRMVERSGHAPLLIDALRTYPSAPTVQDWLHDAQADMLIRLAEEVANNGLYRVYRERSASGTTPHGRISVPETLRRFTSRNLSQKVQYSWFERTKDNPLNQCIKAALSVLHCRYLADLDRTGARERTRRLSSLLHVFEDATPDASRAFLADPVVAGAAHPPSSRSYYRDVLQVAVSILNESGISFDGVREDVRLPSLLLDMGALFEEYVRSQLTALFSDAGLPFEVLNGNEEEGRLSLYSMPSHPIVVDGEALRPLVQDRASPLATPDIVIRQEDGSTPLVIELKNTLFKAFPSRSEVEQAVTYATIYGTRVALLVHPKTDRLASGLQLYGQVGPVSVFDYRYDLGADDMDSEDQLFANAVQGLLSEVGSSQR